MSSPSGTDPHSRNSTKRVQWLHVAVWTAALAVSAGLATVVVLTQIPFYGWLFGPEATPVPEVPQLNLTYLTPVIFESIAWVCTLMSVLAVIVNKPSSRYERLMWLFSLIAGTVNAAHNIGIGRALTGLVLGGFSIAGPLLVHIALKWSREANTDKSASQFRYEAMRRLVHYLRRVAQVFMHPVRVAKTAWLVTSIPVSWEHAYRVVYLGRGGQLKADLEEQFDRARAQARGEHAAIEQTHGPVIEASSDRGSGVHDAAPRGVHGQDAQGVHDQEHTSERGDVHRGVQGVHTPQDGVHGRGATPDEGVQTPDWAQLLFNQIESLHTPSDLDERDVHWGVQNGSVHDVRRPEHSDVHDDDARGVHDAVHTPDEGVHSNSDEDVHTSHEGVHEQSKKQTRKTQKGEHSGRTRKPAQDVKSSTTNSGMSQRDLVAHHYWKLVHDGIDPASANKTQVAAELGIERSVVSRVFKAAGEGCFPDPGPEAFEDQ